MSRVNQAVQDADSELQPVSWSARFVDGATLASCFFAPIIGAHNADAFFLHWTATATGGLLIAFLLVSLLATALVTVADSLTSLRRRAAAALLIGALPLVSLGATLLRRAPSKEALLDAAADPSVRAAVGALAAIGCTLFLAKPSWTLNAVRVGRLALMPVLLVTVTTLARLAAGAIPIAASTAAPTMPPAGSATGHLLVLVFDELSFDRMYAGREIRADFPHLARFGRTAHHYLEATAPGGQTLETMSGYLAVRRFHDVDVQGDELLEVGQNGARRPLQFDARNLFAQARAAGYRTELFGVYIPYCDLMPAVLDRCAAYSLYNTSSLSASASPLDAIRTTLILLPRQFPTGFLKNPPFAAHQRQLADRIETHAAEALHDRPTFRFVHFSIPHSPFVFTEAGYDPPADPLADDEGRYRRQLLYVDAVIGRILARLPSTASAAQTTVVITSDHEWRSMAARSRWPHVPLLVRRPAQAQREDHDQPAAVEAILAALVSGDR